MILPVYEVYINRNKKGEAMKLIKGIKAVYRHFFGGEARIARAVGSFDKTVAKLEKGVTLIEAEHQEAQKELDDAQAEFLKKQQKTAEKHAALETAKKRATSAVKNIKRFFGEGEEEQVELTK